MNRVWANFMGRGLVDPVDDLRATNPASNEELFAALSQGLRRARFDVKHLIRTIMNSAAYQLSSRSQRDQSERQHVLLEVHREAAAGGSAAGRDVAGDRRRRRAFAGYPAGTRALQLPDTQVKSEFLTSFGRPARDHLRCRGAVERSEHCAGAARDQRRHAEQEAERARMGTRRWR